MSKVVDERVVSMQFDNKHFESNVQTTMSTLDKLKAKLNFKDAGKSFENLNSAATKCNLSPLSNAVDTVGLRFNAMYTIADQALRNITNSAMAAGKQIISALTIDPVKTGLSEYETKINAVQVIKANTRGKFDTEEEQMEAIYSALGRLNEYADRTIYNFAQMTNNVGKFVAQTGDVEKSVKAVEGLANLAGASGASAEDMARATYQMSQALGGTIRKIDWNSLRNANMAGIELKNMLTDLAKVKGIDIDGMIASKGTFEDTLEEGWLTGDLFLEAMNIYSDAYSEAELAAMGFNEEQIKNFKDLAATARQATTEVKTVSQMWDVLKETAQSGWTQTWELIIGDFDAARALLSPLAEFFMGIINKMSDARNAFLKAALGSPFGQLAEKLSTFTKVAGSAVDKLEYFQDIVNKVWHGDYKNADTGRYELLEAAGYDHRVVQDLVNKGLGYKLTVEDIEASHKKFGLTIEGTTESTEELLNALNNLSDEQLRNAGLTDDEIAAYRELERQAKETGKPIAELLESLETRSGRELLIDSFKNLGSALISMANAIGKAWREIFDPIKPQALYNALDAFEELTAGVKEFWKNSDNVDKLTRSFKGLFAALDIIGTVVGGGFKIAFKAVSALLSYFNLDILDVTASIGDALVSFRDWIDSLLDFEGAFEIIGPYIEIFADAIKRLFSSLKDSKLFEQFVSSLSQLFGGLMNWLAGIKDAENIPKYIIEGLINGLKAGVKAVWNAALEIGKAVLNAVKSFLGIHSPSTEFKEVGENVTDGFIIGLQNGSSKIWTTIKNIFGAIVEWVKNIDFGALLAAGMGTGMTIGFLKIADAISSFGDIGEGLGEVLEGAGRVLKRFAGILTSIALQNTAEAIKDFAISLAILVAALIALAYVCNNPSFAIWEAIGVLGALAGILISVAAIMALVNKTSLEISKAGLKVNNLTNSLVGIGVAIVLMAAAVRLIGTMSPEQTEQAFNGLAKMVLAIGAVLLACRILVSSGNIQYADKIGKTLVKISVAMLLLIAVAKLINNMEWADMGKAAVGMIGLITIISLLTLTTKIAGPWADKTGAALLKISVALGILVIVAKLIAGMTWEDMGKAYVGLIAFVGIVALLLLATKIAGKDTNKIAATIVGISAAILVMGVVMRMLSTLDPGRMAKGIIAITLFSGIIVGLIAATKLAGENADKIALTILSMSISIGILALIAALLGLVKLNHLAKGITAVGLLAGMMTMMIWATKGANDCKANLIVMVVAIGLMTAAVAVLAGIDTANLAVATSALALLMGMFAVLIKVSGTAKGSMGSLITIAATVTLLAGLLLVLSKLAPETALETSAALSLLLLSLSASMLILGKTGKVSMSTIGALAVLGLVVAELAVILGLMSHFDVNASIENATSLSILLIAMSAVLAVLSIVGTFGSSAFVAIGALAVLGLVVAELAVILALIQHFEIGPSTETVKSLSVLLLTMTGVLVALSLVGLLGPAAYLGVGALAVLGLVVAELAVILALIQHFDVGPSTETVKSLSVLLITMTGVLVVLGLVGLLGPAAYIGVGALLTLITGIGVLVAGIGALATKFPQLEDFLNNGIPVLEKIGYALGSFFGNVVGGFVGGMTSGLPAMAEDLSEFMTKAQPFIDGAKSVDDTVLTGVKALAESFIILTGANILEGLTSWLTGGSSLADFAEQLVPFGNAMVEFSSVIDGKVNESAIVAVANAGKLIAEMASILPNTGGIAGWFAGENDMGAFFTQLVPFGNAMVEFSSVVDGKINESAVMSAVNAGKIVAEMAASLPNSGGALGWFAGENDLVSFASQLVPFGVAIASFSSTVDGKINESAVTSAANAGKIVAEMAASLPNSGGVAGWFAGENDLTSFAKQLIPFGDAIANFSSTVDGKVNEGAVTSAANAGKMVGEMAASLPNSGGIVGWFTSNNDMDKFGKRLVSFGESIADFSDAVSGIASGNISSAVSQVNKLLDLIRGMEGVDFSAIKTFETSMSKVGDSGVTGFVDAFENSSSKVTEAAKTMLTYMASGISNSSSILVNAMKVTVAKVLDSLKTGYAGFYSAGASIAEGFAKGISDKSYKAVAKARAMALAAAEAARVALDINSPSKVFIKLGSSIPEGFAKGISKYGSAIVDSSTGMAQVAMDGTKSAIAKVSELLNTDLDSQPTIRPVLDLSDVRAGASTINGLFGMQPSLELLTNVGSISTMMNGRQNEVTSNDDVVAAIKDLKAVIRDSSGDSYSVGNVTYDDGSNIADTIKALIRQSRIEGRI